MTELSRRTNKKSVVKWGTTVAVVVLALLLGASLLVGLAFSPSGKILRPSLVRALPLLERVFTAEQRTTAPPYDLEVSADAAIDRATPLLAGGLSPFLEDHQALARADTFSALVEGKPSREMIPARAIYMTGLTAGYRERLLELVQLVKETELNAVVVDIKDRSGRTTYQTSVQAFQELGAVTTSIDDLQWVVKTLKENEIYVIARQVVFYDPILANARLELAVEDVHGNPWRDYTGRINWTSPRQRDVWEYNLALSLEAARLGFDEVQYDYVRFPTEGDLSTINHEGYDETRSESVSGFLSYARERLSKYGVFVSADVFGIILSTKHDSGIGQVLEDMANSVDIVCPMIYPSHYYSGSFGFDNPNANPYGVVFASLSYAMPRIEGTGAVMRPWLQDFSWKEPPYGPQEVRAQIDAAAAIGVGEWLLWNAGNRYTKGALRPAGADASAP